jgi:hypothetical protein
VLAVTAVLVFLTLVVSRHRQDSPSTPQTPAKQTQVQTPESRAQDARQAFAQCLSQFGGGRSGDRRDAFQICRGLTSPGGPQTPQPASTAGSSPPVA